MTRTTQTPLARRDVLPISLPPRGLDRAQAAAYIGVSVSKFDQMRADGRISPPKHVDGRIVFDLRRLDKDFENLPDVDPLEAPAASPFD